MDSEAETGAKMEKWRDRDNLQRERKRRWNRGRERESERWRDKRRQREGTGETGQWLPLVPTPGNHSRRALASSVCRFRSAHPGSLGSGSGPPSCRPDTSCQSGLGWHAGRNLPSSQEPDLVLLSFGSAVPSHKCRPGAAQMRRRARAHGHARRSLSADDS